MIELLAAVVLVSVAGLIISAITSARHRKRIRKL